MKLSWRQAVSMLRRRMTNGESLSHASPSVPTLAASTYRPTTRNKGRTTESQSYFWKAVSREFEHTLMWWLKHRTSARPLLGRPVSYPKYGRSISINLDPLSQDGRMNWGFPLRLSAYLFLVITFQAAQVDATGLLTHMFGKRWRYLYWGTSEKQNEWRVKRLLPFIIYVIVVYENVNSAIRTVAENPLLSCFGSSLSYFLHKREMKS